MARRRATRFGGADYRARIHYRLVRRGPPAWARVPDRRGRGAGGAGAMAAAERPPGRRRGPAVAVALRMWNSRASGTGRGSCRGTWMIRCGFSATISGYRRAAPAGDGRPRPGTGTRSPESWGWRPDRRHPSPSPGGGHAQAHRARADRGRDVDRLGDARRWFGSASATSVPHSRVRARATRRGGLGAGAPDQRDRQSGRRASMPTWSTGCRSGATGCRIAR